MHFVRDILDDSLEGLLNYFFSNFFQQESDGESEDEGLLSKKEKTRVDLKWTNIFYSNKLA